MGCLALLLMYVLSFFITALCYWVVTMVLPLVGINIVFSWTAAFAIWVVIGIIKFLLD